MSNAPALPSASGTPSCWQPLPGSCHSQARGQAPGRVPGPLCSHRSCLHSCLLFPGRGGASRTRGVPGAGLVPVCTPGPHAPACRWLAPATAWLVLSMVTSQFFGVDGIYNALSSLFFCSNGRCAFYDFREVFLCSRKCKCHA